VKYRLYVDEVGNPDLKSSENEEHRFLCLAGVAFGLDYMADVLNPDLEELKKRYFDSHPDEPVILHRKEIMHKKPPFSRLKDPEILKKFNEEIITKLTNWDYTVTAIIIDKVLPFP